MKQESEQMKLFDQVANLNEARKKRERKKKDTDPNGQYVSYENFEN